MSVITVSAAKLPMRTMAGLCFIAMSAVANILLSPNSDRKTTPNASVNGRRKTRRLSGTLLTALLKAAAIGAGIMLLPPAATLAVATAPSEPRADIRPTMARATPAPMRAKRTSGRVRMARRRDAALARRTTSAGGEGAGAGTAEKGAREGDPKGVAGTGADEGAEEGAEEGADEGEAKRVRRRERTARGAARAARTAAARGVVDTFERRGTGARKAA